MQELERQWIGGLEAGGTKIVCAVGDAEGNVIHEERFPTETPERTLPEVIAFFKKSEQEFGEIGGLGIGTFGPAGTNRGRSGYGTILKTPKAGWEGADLLGAFREAYPGVPVAFDTDVNAAAVGEGARGAARGLDSFVYVTVGTGIGGGIVVNGKPLSGILHPEIGHIRVPIFDDFEGVCPFHGNCLEGMASGTAMAKRWGVDPRQLPSDHEAWDLEAKYLAAMVQTLTAVLSPERIIFGGGVMEQTQLFPMIREKFMRDAGGYWPEIDDFLVPSQLGNQAGIIGCLILAGRARHG
jgi:fructokinase